MGGAAIDAYGMPIRDEDLARVRRRRTRCCWVRSAARSGTCRAPAVRPEQALLRLRKALGLFANLRPVAAEPALIDASPLRRDLVEGVDMLIVRELTGGLYFGERREAHDGPDGRQAYDTLLYTRARGRAHRAARLRAGARPSQAGDERGQGERAGLQPPVAHGRRRGRARSSRTSSWSTAWSTPARCSSSPRPASSTSIVTENMFGDILSDEASVLAGSLGMLPSASLGETPHRARHPGRLRADPRLRARHRGHGHRQPRGDHPVRRDDAALVVRPAAEAAAHRGARCGGALADGIRTGDLHGSRRRRGGSDPGGHGRLPGRGPGATRCWACAGVTRAARRAGHPVRHDPARRHPGREHHAVARGQAAHRADARRVRHALHRGRLAG